MRAVGLVRLAVAVLVVAVCAVPAWAAPAVVQGAAMLKVRSGPSLQHPAFGRLEEGQQVEVKKVDGPWAAVVLPDGSEGWVNKQYLNFSRAPSARQPTAAPVSEARAAAPPTPGAAQVSEQMRLLSEENAGLAAEVAALRQQLATQTAAPPGAPEAAPGALQADVQRLLRLTEEVRDLVRATPESGTDVGESAESSTETWLASNGWVLAASVVVGGLLGSAYGRLQERRRRTRIRF